MKKLIVLAAFLCGSLANAQTQSFPANKTYSNGLMASSRNGNDAKASYAIWKNNFIQSCNNGRYRVKFDDPNKTVSEGIGYGMLLAAYSGDKTLFDGLWLYYKDNVNRNGVMNWKINGCSGVDGQNGATDAELDVAFALIVADYQWKSAGKINYNKDGKALIKAIKDHEVEANTYILKPGDAFGGSSLTNPSYFSPAYYRAFGAYTNDVNFWNAVASKAYSTINGNLSLHNAVGGLVSDWCEGSGKYSNQSTGYANQGKYYGYDAARTPWRIATDYLWYGTADAKTYSKKSSEFVRVTLGGSSKIKDGYNQGGKLKGQWHNATFVGAFACAAMGGDNQSHLNSSYSDLANLNEPNSYYNQTLKTLYLFTLTGNFYLPGNAAKKTSRLSENTNEEITDAVEGITIYPNPNKGIFTVESPKESQISIFSENGNSVYNETSATENTEINLSNKATGIYFVKVTTGDKTVTKKVMIE